MGKILHWLQGRVKLWTKPATSVLIIGTISDLTRSRTDLIVENALLRQQLIVLNRQIKRPQLTNTERFRLMFLSHFTTFWKQALHIVQPDTLLRWHRELFQFYWRWKSQGTPKISVETIALIQKTAKDNQLWGAERIRGELLKLGIEVSKRIVQRYRPKDRKEYPLPFVRRTVLKFVLPGDEGIAWWEGLSGLCAGFGLRVRYLDQAAVEGLTRWVLNPNLEYRSSWPIILGRIK